MPVTAYILIVSESEDPKIENCLKQAGYAHGYCSEAAFNETLITDGSYDLILKITDDKSGKTNVSLFEKYQNISIPVLIIGDNPLPAIFHSVSQNFSDLELLKRIGSLTRLQIMQRELARRKSTTRLYQEKNEDFDLPTTEPADLKIMLIGQKSETLGQVLLQMENKSKVHVCKNADDVLSELRASQFDAVIILGAGQGDVNFRLCNDIRADSRLFNLPVIFVLNHESNREAAYIHGASDIVLDPPEMPHLFNRTALHVQQADYRYSLQKLFKSSKPLPVTDGPTGLYSFGFMKAHMKALMNDHAKEEKYLSLASLTITNLKEINEQYGYPAGDLMLRQIGSVVSFLVRGEDFCCRYKSGQFLIALPSASKDAAKIALNRVYGVVRNTEFSVVGTDDPVKAFVKMGLSEMQSGDTLDKMIARGLAEN